MDKSCSNCAHRQAAEWSVLEGANVAQMDDARRSRSFLAGEAIYHEGDEATGVYCVSSGLVGIRKVDADGESVLLRLVRPGETFGYRSLLTGTPHGVSAEVLKEGRICHVPAATVHRMAADSPALVMAFFRHLARDMAEAENKVMETVTASCRVRFLRLLVAFGGEADSDEGTRVRLELPVSRQDIASLIGVRSETMSRVIRAIENEGLAHFKGRHVDIPDARRLADESFGSLAA
ncbi:Crp/Fnr family transcriptional regulator [bacterium SCSIO 12827]|nr:Crp/Fnr family transcriptional regulator [bacterium SCSIO 12827]